MANSVMIFLNAYVTTENNRMFPLSNDVFMME